jgi:hypothetical protein
VDLINGEEVGATVVIDIDVETVLNVWGRPANCDKTMPWSEDTVVRHRSNTKR